MVTVAPVSTRTVTSPWPESPSDEPEDCEYPEEAEESEGEEAEAVWIVAYWSEEDPADRCYGRDYRYEGYDSPEEEATRMIPLMLTRLVSPPL